MDGPARPAADPAPLRYEQAVVAIREFVAANRWRLHSLFGRLKHDNDDYRITVEEMTRWLAMVGGIDPASKGVLTKGQLLFGRLTSELLFLDAKLLLGLIESHFRGTLRNVLRPCLLRYVCSCGMDAQGRVDYRAIVDDYAVRRCCASVG